MPMTMNVRSMRFRLWGLFAFAGACACSALTAVAHADVTRSPEDVFAHPPHAADVGVWWHWMGSQISEEGIVKDLDYFQRMGIGYATIFGLADTVEPWATPVAGGPFGKVVAFTPDWWKFVKFACREGRRRGIEIGIHNCPGYTSTGGPWIPPRLAMRELVFNISRTNPVPLTAHADYPIWDAAHGRFGVPDEPSRRTDLVDIATVNGIRVSHVPMGAFVQPAQEEARGLECDKMSPEAVAFHMDHVIGELKRHLGDEVGKGLTYVLLDSYEAGTPTWTPNMAAEFKARRGYDCVPLLPVLGGFHVADAATEAKFRRDFDETRKDLYRDALFKIMRAKLSAAGLKFECEPYSGPFRTGDGVAVVDRPMCEFWQSPHPKCRTVGIGYNRQIGPDGKRHNIVEAEAFTGQPTETAWCETLASLKPMGDIYFQGGVNRLFLHSNPLQPYGDDVRPGMTMGRWGTHFGRTQTWAEPAKAWFGYLRRCQALLQWGELSDAKLSLADPVRSLARSDGKRVLHFVVNMSDEETPFALKGRWFDPVTGVVGASPARLAPRQSGFLEEGVATGPVASASASHELKGPWRIRFGERSVETAKLIDWTKSDDADVRYFSGTAVYTTSFDVDRPEGVRHLSLGETQGHVCEVSVNGKPLGIVWTAPWRVVVPSGVLRERGNELVVRYTNTWANRLIGDERFEEDCTWLPATHGGWYPVKWPDWLGQGLTARPSKGRKAWCAWKHFKKDDALQKSGLLGPVSL